MMRGWLPSFVMMLISSPHAWSQPVLPSVLRDVGFDQNLNGQVPLDLVFRDESGQTIRLGDCFHDRPVILVLAWYRCPMLCTEVLNGLVRVLLDIPLDIGKDFSVVTVSFDSRETPEMAAAKKKTYLERFRQLQAEENWHFLTGDQESIDRLTQAVGFRYTYDAKNDQFAHASGLVVLTPSGKVSRYFYDINYSARDLRLGMVEASANKIGSPVDQVLLFCFHYDPTEGKYGPVIMNFVRLGGVLTMIGIGTFLGIMWRQERRPLKKPTSMMGGHHG
jgi:protein SCO1/2